jgi:hypothetical protein
MEPYLSGQFGFIDDPDRQFGNGSVWTRTRTRSDGPEPLLTLGETLPEKVVVRQCAEGGNGLQAGNDPVLDPSSTYDNLELKSVAEEKKLHETAKVHDVSAMLPGSQTLRTTQ